MDLQLGWGGDMGGRVGLKAALDQARPLCRAQLAMVRTRTEQVGPVRALGLEIERRRAQLLRDVLLQIDCDLVRYHRHCRPAEGEGRGHKVGKVMRGA